MHPLENIESGGNLLLEDEDKFAISEDLERGMEEAIQDANFEDELILQEYSDHDHEIESEASTFDDEDELAKGTRKCPSTHC